jgi:hypothetical protein
VTIATSLLAGASGLFFGGALLAEFTATLAATLGLLVFSGSIGTHAHSPSFFDFFGNRKP